jgi:hypothetical protein
LSLSDSPQLIQRSAPFLLEAPQLVQNMFIS